MLCANSLRRLCAVLQAHNRASAHLVIFTNEWLVMKREVSLTKTCVSIPLGLINILAHVCICCPVAWRFPVTGKEEMEEVLSSASPDELGSYWGVIYRLVLQGCLGQVVDLLQKNSGFHQHSNVSRDPGGVGCDLTHTSILLPPGVHCHAETARAGSYAAIHC